MFTETDARRAVFLHALADQDKNQILLTDALVAAAARDVGPLPETDRATRVQRYTMALEDRLEKRHGFDVNALYRLRYDGWLVNLALASLVVGLLSNYLGDRQVNVLWNPLMGLLAWNLGVYLLMTVRGLVWRRAAVLEHHPLLQALLTWLQRIWPTKTAAGDTGKLLTSAYGRFVRHWPQAYPRLVRGRLTKGLHILAIALTLGAIAGMYVRGLGQAFRFTWASTFIDDPEPYLSVLFAPVLWLAGGFFPESLPAFDGSADAQWIHLFAMAASLYIVLPRLVLVILARRTVRRALARLTAPGAHPLDQRLQLAVGGSSRPVFVISYGVTPEPSAVDQLRRLARRHWGLSFESQHLTSVPWGEQVFTWPDVAKPPAWILLFNGAQTPEAEVHGQFLQHFNDQLQDHDKDPQVHVVVDRQGVAADRAESRHDAWRHLLRQADWPDHQWVDLAADTTDVAQNTEANG